MELLVRVLCTAGCSLLLVSACQENVDVPLEPFGGDCPIDEATRCGRTQRGCGMEEAVPTCLECPTRYRATREGVCEPIQGERLHHRFGDFTTEPGEEVANLCQSWTLHNETEIFVHAVELEQNQGGHHSNWTYVPDHFFRGPDGVWPCAERRYEEISAAVLGGVLYAQSTQATHEVQHFAEGAVIRLPPHARIIGDVHIINYETEQVTGRAELSLYLTPPSEVQTELAPFRLTFNELIIPARTASQSATTCDIASLFESVTRGAVDARLHYVLPHTHRLGTRVFLQAVGGPLDGQMLVDALSTNGEALGVTMDPPMDLSGIEALRFGCEYENPRSEVVNMGIGDQEMCVMLGFLESPVHFSGSAGAMVEVGEAEGLAMFESETCQVVGARTVR